MKTLITTIIILITLILLAGIIAPRFFASHSYTKWDAARPKMVPIEAAIETFKQKTGQFPNKLEDLVYAPIGHENIWKKPYLKKSQLYDPWDNPFLYKIDASDPNNYIIISLGNDGRPGGEGYGTDIYND